LKCNILLVPVSDYLGIPYPNRQIEIFERIHDGREMNIHILRFPIFEKVTRVSRAQIHQMPGSASGSPLTYYLRNMLACISQIKKMIARDRIDLIVIASYAVAFADRVFKIFPYHSIPVIFDLCDHPNDAIHDSTSRYLVPQPIVSATSILLSNGLESVMRGSRVVTVVSHALSEYVKTNFGRSSVYLPNGVSEQMFNDGDRERVRKELGIGENETVVGFVGAIAEWVDLRSLLYGFQRVVKAKMPFRLVLVGPVRLGYLNYLRKLVAELGLNGKVVYTGYIAHEVVHHYISAFDLCTIPFDVQNPISMHAGPIKMWEYLAQGRPVISTPIPESLCYHDLLSIVSSSVDYTKIFLQYVEDPQPFLEKAHKGRQVAEQMTWSHIAGKMQELIVQLCK